MKEIKKYLKEAFIKGNESAQMPEDDYETVEKDFNEWWESVKTEFEEKTKNK